jgi:hypothetical protein
MFLCANRLYATEMSKALNGVMHGGQPVFKVDFFLGRHTHEQNKDAYAFTSTRLFSLDSLSSA